MALGSYSAAVWQYRGKLGMFVIQVTLFVNKLSSLLRDGDNERPCFSDFVLKIRLIRLGFLSKNKKPCI